MKELGTVLKKEPFAGRLVIGGEADVIAAVSACKKVVVAAFEGDYLFYGCALRDKLAESGLPVQAYSLDDGFNASGLFEEEGLAVIAVGGRKIIDIVRSKAVGAYIVFVPTSLEFYYAFSPMISVQKDKLLSGESAPLPDKVVFDLGLLSKLKLKHLADGLCVAACAAFWQLETKKEAITDLSEDFLSIKESVKSVVSSPYRALIACQIYAAHLVYNAPYLDFLTDRYTAFLLSKDKDAPENESRFCAAKYAAEFYSTVFSKDITANLEKPDYNGLYLTLSSYTGAPEGAVYERVKPLDAQTCRITLKKLFDEDFSKAAKGCADFLSYCQSVYSAIYKGRKKRFDIAPRSVVVALVLSGVLTETPMRVLTDYGITQALLEIK